jgi:hypothetical protein
MATIHFVKDGKKGNGERITRSDDIAIDVATKALGRFETRRTDQPPTINPNVTASDFAPYKHVVLEVGKGEANSSFPEQGYYYIIGLDASECQRMVGLTGPAI